MQINLLHLNDALKDIFKIIIRNAEDFLSIYALMLIYTDKKPDSHSGSTSQVTNQLLTFRNQEGADIENPGTI